MMKRNRWRLACVAYVVCCALVDLFPWFGGPFFRYMGSDPSVHVWNLGWPLALFIFDSRSGLHVGPFVGPMFGLQVVVFGLIARVYVMTRARHNTTGNPKTKGSHNRLDEYFE